MRTIKIGSMFSGCDGLALAVQMVTLGRVVWHAEIEPHGVKVLEHHWPGVPNLGDVSAIDWSKVERPDILVGGFPCQDISLTGKGEGIEGERSGLWKCIVDAVRVLRPPLLQVENVAALFVRGFDVVAADLASVGYRFTWACYSSEAVGAPHRRDRVFILATPDTNGERQHGTANDPEQAGRPVTTKRRRSRSTADSDSLGLRHEQGRTGRKSRPRSAEPVDDRATVIAAAWERAQRCEWPRGIALAGEPADAYGTGLEGDFTSGDDADGCGIDTREVSASDPSVGDDPWQEGAPDGDPEDSEGDDPGLTINGEKMWLNPSFVEWLMGFPPGWTAMTPRRPRLKLLGNSVQPQTAAHAFKCLLQRLVEIP